MKATVKAPRQGERIVVTDYWADKHRPYIAMLHSAADKPLRHYDVIERAIEAAGARDGDEIVIVAIKTGRRPFGDRRLVLTEPHTYKRER